MFRLALSVSARRGVESDLQSAKRGLECFGRVWCRSSRFLKHVHISFRTYRPELSCVSHTLALLYFSQLRVRLPRVHAVDRHAILCRAECRSDILLTRQTPDSLYAHKSRNARNRPALPLVSSSHRRLQESRQVVSRDRSSAALFVVRLRSGMRGPDTRVSPESRASFALTDAYEG